MPYLRRLRWVRQVGASGNVAEVSDRLVRSRARNDRRYWVANVAATDAHATKASPSITAAAIAEAIQPFDELKLNHSTAGTARTTATARALSHPRPRTSG